VGGGFQFRLERVLDWRKRKFELALSLQENLRSERSQIVQSILATTSEMSLRVNTLMSGLELASYQHYLGRLQRDIVRLEERLKNVDSALHEQRKRVIEADRDVKVLERLREKRLDEWNEAAERELELLAGDVVTNRWCANDDDSRSAIVTVSETNR
jgi:flagellar protein FliJ